MSGPIESVSSPFTMQAFWCCFFGGGIIGSLLIYGLLQERIMTLPYGEDRFTDSVFLVFCNRIWAVLFSVAMTWKNSESFSPVAPIWKYLVISLSNVFASTCQYEALLYVSFPVQMLGKSFKMMPVMIWGIIISGKQYKFADWLIAAMVTGGVTEFLLTGPTAANNALGNSMYGFLLLACFLALDGLTSTMQEKLFKEYKTTKYNQMLYVNSCSSVVSFLTLATTGGVGSALAFCGKHPSFFADASVLSASAVAAQWFIYSQVKEFGALVFAATMNVRQLNSIMVSYAKYGTSITGLQVLGLLVVFSGLFYKSYLGFVGEKDEKTPLVDKLGKIPAAETDKASDKGQK